MAFFLTGEPEVLTPLEIGKWESFYLFLKRNLCSHLFHFCHTSIKSKYINQDVY